MDPRSPAAPASDAAQALANQAAKYRYRLEGDASEEYKVVDNETGQPVTHRMDHHAAARECGRLNLGGQL